MKSILQNNNYWLYIEPYVHITLKNNNILFYNTLNGESIKYFNKPIVAELVKRLISKRNQWVLKIDGEMLSIPVIQLFISEIKNKFIGDVIPVDWSDKKPFVFVPYPIVNRKLGKQLKLTGQKSTLEYGKYLNELTLYLNNVPNQVFSDYSELYKQTTGYYSNSSLLKQLDFMLIESIIEKNKYSYLQKINLAGGDILQHPEINNIIGLLNNLNYFISYFLPYSVINIENINILNNVNQKNSVLKILFPSGITSNIVANTIALLKEGKATQYFTFIIEEESKLAEIEKIIEQNKIEKYQIIPYFNGLNIDFFKEMVYLEEQTLLDLKQNQKKIFANISLNQLNFGRLTILSNGDVYGNVNFPKLGNIKKQELMDCIFNEVSNSKSWLLTRNKVKPCKNCIYQDLCPPISDYEFIINQHNLCNVTSMQYQ